MRSRYAAGTFLEKIYERSAKKKDREGASYLTRTCQKHIIRLAVEERRSQEEVCALLNGISLRTLQRDQAEALDLLAQL